MPEVPEVSEDSILSAAGCMSTPSNCAPIVCIIIGRASVHSLLCADKVCCLCKYALHAIECKQLVSGNILHSQLPIYRPHVM